MGGLVGTDRNPLTRFEIGILAGSGPEAGIDLWQAVLDERRHRLGAAYRGDLDAPAVLVRSDPRLGLSMDLERNGAVVQAVATEHAGHLDASCAAWAIACNTINRYAGEIRAAGCGTTLVAFPDAVRRWLETHATGSVAVLGARPVTSFGPMSAYADLAGEVVALHPGTGDRLHDLIEDIKVAGPPYEGLVDRFASICSEVEADHILLACTELPLLGHDDARLVDVTRLVASAMLDVVESTR